MKCGCYVVAVIILQVRLCGTLYAQANELAGSDTTLDSLLNIRISTAAKYDQAVSEAPASVTIITKEEIARYGYRTLDEVLTTVAGFYTSYDRNYAYVGVRGFGRPTDYNDRVLLLIDGHTTNDNFYGSASIGSDFAFDLASIDRIEIVHGPGSALYGNGAMLAVINVITQQGSQVDGLRVSSGMGSYGRTQTEVLFGKRFADGFDFMVSGFGVGVKGQDIYYHEYDSPANDNGIARNLDWDSYSGLFTSLTYDHFRFLGNIASRSKGIPTGSFDMVFNDPRAMTLDERSFAEASYETNVSKDKSIFLRTYYDHYGYEGAYPYADSGTVNTNSDKNDGNWAGGEFQIRWDAAANNRIVAGVEYKDNIRAYYRSWTPTTVYFDANFPFTLFSAYLEDEYQVLENLMITVGLRRDAYSTAGSTTTPRVAAVFQPFPTSTVKLLYGEAFRAPNVYETNYFDPVSGFKANPSLQSENIKTTELVWEQRVTGSYTGSVSLYHYEMGDLIDQVLDPTDSLIQYQNISRVRANGIELQLNARLAMGLVGRASYSYQEALDGDSGERLTNSPFHLAKLGLSCPLANLGYVSAEVQYESDRITLYGTTTDPYLLTNMCLSTKPLWEHCSASLLIRNLFNVSYQTPGGFEHRQPAITQDGRNYVLALDLNF